MPVIEVKATDALTTAVFDFSKYKLCLIDSATKIRNSIPVAAMEVKPEESELQRINLELKTLHT